MLEAKILGLMIIIRSLFCGCAVEPKSTGFEKNKGEYRIKAISRLPKGFLESSGLAVSNDTDIFYTHTDSGGENHLYKINTQGEVLDTLIVDGAKNNDWEDLTSDDKGNIYIGDFGNNLNRRKDLKVFKYNPDTNNLEVILFSFEDQDEFPPLKNQMNFDVEGFFWKDGALHLFSKNRGLKCIKYYIMPDQPGSYKLTPSQSTYLNGMITAADKSPDGKLLALLSYGKIYLFKADHEELAFSNPYKCLPFTKGAQSEGLVFINDTDFIISNETGKLFLAKKRNKRKVLKD